MYNARSQWTYSLLIGMPGNMKKHISPPTKRWPSQPLSRGIFHPNKLDRLILRLLLQQLAQEAHASAGIVLIDGV
jgi:hypothetical protein